MPYTNQKTFLGRPPQAKKTFLIHYIPAMCLVIVLLVYVFVFLPPKFNAFIIDETKNEADRVANHLVSLFIKENTDLSNPRILDHLIRNDVTLRQTLQLAKLKLFTHTGEVVYSTDLKDVGSINDNDYFFNIIANGNVYSKWVKKESRSAEGQLVHFDVVETYVPILRDGLFIGAFEIYYDVTKTKAKLDNLINKIYFVLVLISASLLGVILVSGLKIKKSIDRQNQYEQTLHKLSITDELTGLLNRRGFMSLAERHKDLAERSGQLLLIIYSDIDGMKWINDNLGHDAGDEALRETAGLLNETFRKADIVCRLGGDEFAVLLTCESGDDSIAAIEKRFYENLEAINRKEGRLFKLQISLGVCRYDEENTSSLSDLITRADKLMYERKQHRKNL